MAYAAEAGIVMTKAHWLRFLDWFQDVFRIEGPLDENAVIVHVRKDIEFRGARAWILVTAVIIASLGLNTNSTAVIIGAMLISPLMGPIIGIGTALSSWDINLLSRSARNMGIAVAISLFTSAVYFLITPLGEAQSELIARTTPTLLDALIALAGGVAGAVAVVRLDRSNVVPGVAIATALMPPLCTAGYGIAHFDLTFMLGGFYLFFVNGVCISAATYTVMRIAGMHKHTITDPKQANRVRLVVILFVIVTLVPSVIVGYRIVQESTFNRHADDLITEVRKRYPEASVLLTYRTYTADSSMLELTLVGTNLNDRDKNMIDSIKANHDLTRTRLLIRQPGDALLMSRSGVPSERLNGVLRATEDALARRTRSRDSLASILRTDSLQVAELESVVKEAALLFKNVSSLSNPTTVVRWPTDGSPDTTRLVRVQWKRTPSRTQVDQLQSWLRIRLKDSTIDVDRRRAIGEYLI